MKSFAPLVVLALSAAGLRGEPESLRAFGRDFDADHQRVFTFLGDSLRVRGYGHLWTREPSYDLSEAGSACRVRLEARLAEGRVRERVREWGELIVGFSANRKGWHPDESDALTFRIGCDALDGIKTAVRTRMYGHFEATSNASLAPGTWATVELLLSARGLRAAVDDVPVVEARLAPGSFPLRGHVGILGYRLPLTEIRTFEIETIRAGWFSGPAGP